MRTRIVPTILCALVFFIPSVSLAANEKFWNSNFYLENDLFAETDAEYTNGIRVSFMTSEIDRGDDKLPSLLANINRKLRRVYELDEVNITPQYNFVGSIGQRIYTPTDKDRTDIIIDERPYAGWLYFSLANHTRLGPNLVTVELDLGIIGPASLAKEAQDLIHDARDLDRFQGWDHQLDNELGFSLIYERKRKFQSENIRFGLGTDLITHWGGSIGNVATYLNGGAEARFGWDIPDDFGTSALRPAGDNTAPGASATNKSGIHLFTSVDARWVMRDIFLDGNTFSDSHSVDKKKLVMDAAVGLSLNIGALKFSYSRVLRTKEYNRQNRYHSYGSIAVSYWRKF